MTTARHKVSDPITMPADVGNGPVTIVAHPCSRDHREIWLQGFIVASCRKCKWGRVDD